VPLDDLEIKAAALREFLRDCYGLSMDDPIVREVLGEVMDEAEALGNDELGAQLTEVLDFIRESSPAREVR